MNNIAPVGDELNFFSNDEWVNCERRQRAIEGEREREKKEESTCSGKRQRVGSWWWEEKKRMNERKRLWTVLFSRSLPFKCAFRWKRVIGRRRGSPGLRQGGFSTLDTGRGRLTASEWVNVLNVSVLGNSQLQIDAEKRGGWMRERQGESCGSGGGQRGSQARNNMQWIHTQKLTNQQWVGCTQQYKWEALFKSSYLLWQPYFL